jgi:LmbE family N-acetylglucosaminyl deacetylase
MNVNRVQNNRTNNKLSVLFVGAHPDDAEFQVGGTAIKYVQAGHKVTFMSMTNGDAGHQEMGGAALAQRRYNETRAVAEFLGIDYVVLDNHDGQLVDSVENRDNLIRIIREIRPDLIITHRLNDYHTDHRHTSLLVQNASYLVAVPNVAPLSPRLDYNPVIVYHQDDFTKPYPFTPDVFVDITDVFDKKMEALALHESQIFEWIPFIDGYLAEVPKGKKERLEWLTKQIASRYNAAKYQPLLEKLVSADQLKRIQVVEAFEACEYGGRLTPDNVARLFPFGIHKLA